MEKHKVPLNTLKECLQFLLWLHQNGDKQQEVAEALHRRLSGKYNTVGKKLIEQALSQFLTNVSRFHTKLCTKPQQSKINPSTATTVLNALLDCIPKFLAVMYFLRYQVDIRFAKLGGGKWKGLQIGGSKYLGGDLQAYLTEPSSSKYGVIPGGFGRLDLRRDYRQASQMANDLTAICEKHSHMPNIQNFFLDVFTTSVLSTAGPDTPNTANALALVSTLCGIVDAEPDTVKGGQLKPKMDESLNGDNVKKCICWSFKRDRNRLSEKEFAEETAKWLRENLDKVKTNLGNIKIDEGVLKILRKDHGDYFTKKFFPYGFTFDRYNLEGQKTPHDVLSGDWSSVINELTREHEGLEKLKKILEGQECPPEPPHEVVPEKKVPVVPPKKSEAPPATKTEGNQNQGKKSEGAQNQGKKVDGTSPSPTGKSVVHTQSSGGPGDAGPAGPNGDAGSKGSTVTVLPGSPISPGSPVQNADQRQRTDDTLSPGLPPPPPPPRLPGGGDAVGQPGVGQLSPTGDASGSQSIPPPITSPTQTPSVGGSSPGSQGGQDASQSTSQPSDHDPSSVGAPSGAPAPGVGENGGGGCSNPIKFPAEFGGGKYCPRDGKTWDSAERRKMHEEWDEKVKEANQRVAERRRQREDRLRQQKEAEEHKREDEERRKQAEYEYKTLELQKRMPYLGGQNVFSPSRSTYFGGLDGNDLEDDYDNGSDLIKQQQAAEAKWKKQQEDGKRLKQSDDYAARQQEKRREAADALQKKLDEGDPQAKKEADWVKQAEEKELRQQRGLQEYLNYLQRHRNNHAPVIRHPLPEPGDLALEGEIVKNDSDMELQDPSEIGHERYLISRGAEIKRRREELNKHQKEAAGRYKSYEEQKYANDQRDASDVFTGIVPSNARGMPKVSVPEVLASIVPVGHTIKPPKWPRPPKNTPYVRDILDVTGHRVLQPDPMRSPIPSETIAPPMSLMTEFSGSPTDDARGNYTMPPSPQIDFDIQKVYTPDKAYENEGFQYIPLPVKYNKIASQSDLPPLSPYLETFDPESLTFPTVEMCVAPWASQHPAAATDIPETELFPSEAPRTVRDMLVWLAGLRHPKHQETLTQCINNAFKRGDDISASLTLPVNDSSIAAKDVIDTIHLAAIFAGSVLSAVAPEWRMAVPSAKSTPEDPDCCALLCQLRDYVYACYYQLAFLKSQCSRNQSDGGWQDYQYGRDVSFPKSPLQAFLTDTSNFETHLFDPCNICLKSHVNMGFKQEDLPEPQQTGKHISTILSPTCGGDDPLLTLSSHLNCLTRRTPRTTGELVSFFHNFGNSLHNTSSQLSQLGISLSKPHGHCPEWDCLEDADLRVIKDARGSAPPNSNSIHDKDKDHPNILSTLLGCGITNAKCPQLMKPITYRAYALYSTAFVHHYLSWVTYLADRLWDSLLRLQDDLEDLQCHDAKSKPLHQCDKALPLLYSHGFTPPDGILQLSLTCSEVIDKLWEVVNGEPIADLMTAMDNLLYGIRLPFLYTVFTLWSVAVFLLAHTMLYLREVLPSAHIF
ncbi:Ribosome-binding protein 1, putative [Babesia ovata]|uniref:Ribosome-binding protein 1, putative n=1 Tax=Babesia ovata TaxID=189622 RepID=A0A2H6K852_9APIC|nr:Ribosome-binding protein 1, putative [Babesia ovata]GBE59177.1 Ribosome-binding protein 1, putative [Babesia ovata]